MKSMQKRPARRVSKEKAIPVANDSLQTKAPGAGPGPSRGNEQSSSQQRGFGGDEAGERGGPGAQQTGWSSRQQAERIQARGEESRLGMPQQSGYGGAEQDQHAGSQESPTGPPSSQQPSEHRHRRKTGVNASQSGSGGTHSKRGSDSKQ
jgi:hypothetical protein